MFNVPPGVAMVTVAMLLFIPPTVTAQSVLPPEVVESLLKAAERVAAVAQDGVLCQARKQGEQTRLAEIRKEQLEINTRIRALERDLELLRIDHRESRAGSPDRARIQARSDEAKGNLAQARQHLTQLRRDENEAAGNVKDHDTCVANAQKRLAALRAGKD